MSATVAVDQVRDVARRATAATLVELDDVSASYGRRSVLDRLSISVESGITALLGPNGAGKSTLMRVLSGLLQPSGGDVRVAGRSLVGRGRAEAQRLISLMPQDMAFVPHLRVRMTLEYFGLLKDVSTAHLDAEIDAALQVAKLTDRASDKVGALSGGMQRRLAFAVAQMGDPRLLLLDEPTVGLDPAQRLYFRDAIVAQAEQRAVVFATHQIEDVALLDCRLVVLLPGSRVIDSPSVEAFMESSGLQVWESAEASPSALVSWRSGARTVRNVGERIPASCVEATPSLEEIYLGVLRQAETKGV